MKTNVLINVVTVSTVFYLIIIDLIRITGYLNKWLIKRYPFDANPAAKRRFLSFRF